MRKLLLAVISALALAFVWPVHSQSAAAQQAGVSGRWIVTADFHGTPIYMRLTLDQQGEKLSGTFSGEKLDGTISGAAIHFIAKGDDGSTDECTASLSGASMSGTVVSKDPDDPEHPETRPFTAVRVPPRPSGPPQRHEFVPTVFYRQFSPLNKPILTVSPGDTVHTTTVDAGGTDEKGITRVLGGNPETGPFYIESAMPGDVLVVHLNRLRLNRDWAISDDAIVDRALDSDLAVKMKDAGKSIRWHLDIAKGIATPEKPSEHLANYSVPLKPMLGCVATAPQPSQAPPGTGDSGRYGGNMDFNENVEGTTIYLPVSVPGAMLYLGDGHAAQGDGELNGNALETSMDVEFTVDVVTNKRFGGLRVETPTHIIAMALAGSLDEAFRGATSNMAAWLERDYALTPSEIAQVLGTSAEYRVSEVADRNAGMVLRISKERIKALPPAPQK